VVKLSPVKSPVKVYIIDEAHMLTIEASNALLKTLEEPPKHVYFILATTNPEKIIGTIKSRASLIVFSKAKNDEIMRSLKRVAVSENIKISKESLEKISKLAKGSFRDGVKLLEKLSVEGDGFLNKSGADSVNLIKTIESKDFKEIISKTESLLEKGLFADEITEEILGNLRMMITGEKKTVLNPEELISLTELLINSLTEIKISPIEQLPLELAFYKWLNKYDGSGNLEKDS